MPYFLVSDDACGLKIWLMKPLPLKNMTDSQRMFNYRLSRARRVVENAFGITANRFRCLLTTMPQQPDTVTTVVLSCCVLHNLLRLRKPNADLPVDKKTQIAMNWCPASGETTANFQTCPETTGHIRMCKLTSKDSVWLST